MIINPFENLNLGTSLNQTRTESVIIRQSSDGKKEDPFNFVEEKYSTKKASYSKTSRYVQKQN